jgi:hypothetical protein
MARYSRTQTIQHDIGSGGRLSLKVTSADVRVRGVDGQAVTVRASFDIPAASEQEADAVLDQVKLESSTAPGELTVSEPSATGGSGLGAMIGRIIAGRGDVDYSVEIELPRHASLELETVSGEVTSDGLRGTQHYVTVSGDLFVDDTGGGLRADTVSGDIVIRADLPVGARVNAVSGDVSLTAPRLESLRLNTVSGDIAAEGELSPAGSFRVDTVSGDFDIGLVGDATIEVRGIATDISSDVDHRIEGRLDRRRLVIGSGQPLLTFGSMSGDLAVRRPRRLRAAPLPPTAPSAPAAPAAPLPEDEQLAVLQALERGEIDVDEAARRLGGGRSDA